MVLRRVNEVVEVPIPELQQPPISITVTLREKDDEKEMNVHELGKVDVDIFEPNGRIEVACPGESGEEVRSAPARQARIEY